MAEIFQFIPKHKLESKKNLDDFICLCRDKLTVFGADLDWDADYWPSAKCAFGNIDQTTRKIDPSKVMQNPFKNFAKAYFRYQQGHRPNASRQELGALKSIERALVLSGVGADIQHVNLSIFDQAAIVAKEHYASGKAYHTGRELERLAVFFNENRLVSTTLSWKNPHRRPIDTVRTGQKAKDQREKKLPTQDALDALADAFAGNPAISRDIFTTSVVAMLLSAPSRMTEVLALPVDCEVWETKRDGSSAYGWRFQPGKEGDPMIKWIPDAMVSIATEAVDRIRKMTEEARRVSSWLETHPQLFYRHALCPNVGENEPLTVVQVARALGISCEENNYVKKHLRRLKLPNQDYLNTLASLNLWVHQRLPKDFPWYDKGRGIRYSNALFCVLDKQLRTDLPDSPFMVQKPTVNVVNFDLDSRETSENYVCPGLFDRLGYNNGLSNPLKVTSHQFRHLLNTMAQRGGLSQAEIARWSGRADMKQNRVYDHMSEFELVDMLRSHDTALSLDSPLEEIAEQIATQLPMTQQEFNVLAMPTAHVTEYGFCVHDFVMSPCQRFRDCMNCSEQVCIKGDRRLERIRARYEHVRQLKDRADQEIKEGAAGADRWYEIHSLTEARLKELIGILENPSIENGVIIRLRNEFEFSPLRRVLESKTRVEELTVENKPMLEDLRSLMEIDNG